MGESSFEDIVEQARKQWLEKLSKIEIDVMNTPPNVTEMLYSSLYRASLTPVRCGPWSCRLIRLTLVPQNNATGETQGVFADTTSFYFDSLYCRFVCMTLEVILSQLIIMNFSFTAGTRSEPTLHCHIMPSHLNITVPDVLPPDGITLPRRICSNRRQLHRWVA